MNPILSLGFWVLLSFATVCGLMCYRCDNERSNGTCFQAKPPCIARPGESCYRQELYTEYVRLYSVAGCVKDCQEISGGQNVQHVYKCCSNADLCNFSSS